MTPAVYRVIVLPNAMADLDNILTGVAAKSPNNAASVFDHLWASIQSLRELPHRYTFVQGRNHPAGPVRRMAVPPYVVYYRTSDRLHVVRVLTVMHGRQRRPRTFES